MLFRSRFSCCGLHRTLLSVFVFPLIGSLASACLWDWDTLQMERHRFPGAHELITGKFVRHSLAYYEWRIQDRTKRMRSPTQDPQLADDLAVAYSKLGRHPEGIALLEQVLVEHPNRYETLSNLGTIHMLAGDLKTGKDYIDQAIVINPNAHFGREKYQSLLAEYWLTERKTPHVVSEDAFTMQKVPSAIGFAKFILDKHGQNAGNEFTTKISDELSAAEKGVLGMMHFADFNSPMLLEALGDILIRHPASGESALHLASRAYYRIAQLSTNSDTRKIFEKVARKTIEGNLDYVNWRRQQQKDEKVGEAGPDDLEKLSANLKNEMENAQTFVATVEADEKRWISQGIDVDQAFAAKYYDSLDDTIEEARQQLFNEPRDVRGNPLEAAVRRAFLLIGASLAGIVALTTVSIFAIRRYRVGRIPPLP